MKAAALLVLLMLSGCVMYPGHDPNAQLCDGRGCIASIERGDSDSRRMLAFCLLAVCRFDVALQQEAPQ